MTDPTSEAPRRRTLSINGPHGAGDMALIEFGDATRPVDLVLLHANGFNALTYRTLLAPLAEQGLRILAPDLRGHGRTRLPTVTEGRFDWHDLRDDILALLASLDGPPPVLAGHSMGAVTALLAAAEQPDRVRRLVLMDPVIWPRPMAAVLGLPLIRQGPRRAPIAKAALRRRSRFDSPEAALEAYRGRGAFKGWPEAVLADYLADGLIMDDEGAALACAPAWEASNYAAQGHNPWRALKRISLPTHVLKAEINSTCSLGPGRFDHVRVEAVPGGTHFFPMLQPEIARAALSEA